VRHTQAIYRALLRCYPAAFRDEYGGQMSLMFDEQLRDARRTGRTVEPFALWLRAMLDTAIVAPREHAHVIAQDLRYALRTMAARPGFSAVAILSLALGIGANTAIFSLWNGVLRAPLPGVRSPEQLVILSNPDGAGSWTGRTGGVRSWLTYEEFEQLRDRADAMSQLMASQSSLNDWQVRVDGGAPEEASGRFVSGGFFEVLGVAPAIGRVFTAGDDRLETPHAVISHTYWQRRFGGRPDVLGRTLTLRNAVVTIIGVGPRGFVGETSGQQPDLWLPLRMQPRVQPIDRLHDTPPTKSMWLHVFGRLKPGVTAAQADAQANTIFRAGLESFYGAPALAERGPTLLDQRLQVRPSANGASTARGGFSQSLAALLAGVAVLLLMACANLANLLLARSAARRSEIAIRLSLGASRGRIVRQQITESLTLAAIGGAAAFPVAYAMHGVLVGMLTKSDEDFRMSFALDPLIAAFVAGVTVAAALVFGVLPAWRASRADAGAALKEQSRGAGGTFGQLRSGRILVSLQLALSLPLLVGAGLLARTVYNLQRADLGFPSDHLLLAHVNLRDVAPDAARRDIVRRELLAAIERMPGVRAASVSQLGLFSGGESSSSIEVEGLPPSDRNRESAVDYVGPGYFSALGMSMRLGREILESDRTGGADVCVINDAFAKRFFDGRNPIGMHVTAIREEGRPSCRVVGVAGNARTQSLRGEIEPRFFVPAAQRLAAMSSPIFVIRTATDAARLTTAVRTAIQRVDAALPILSVTSLEERMAPLTAQDRTTAQLAIAFGSVALALAAIGLYGVLAYGIARRTGEIAIRLALGARRSRVVAMILRETLGLLVVGLVLGGRLAYAAVRLIDSRLYGVAPQDALTLVSAVSLLALVALSAAYVPARRASRLDPMAALRQS
jgi:predicted permease